MTYIKTRLKQELNIDSIITIHYFEYMKDFVFNGESHDFWEFLYVDKGTVSVCADDTWMILSTGDIIFHRPNEFHSIKSIGKNSPNLVAVSFECNSPAMDFFIRKSFRLTAHERSLISHIISEGRNALSTPLNLPSVEQVITRDDAPFASQQMILLYLQLFLITVLRNHSEEHEHPQMQPHAPDSPSTQTLREERLKNILQYMEDHICDQIKISDICETFNISRSSLQNIFHSTFECGVIDYFNNLKIKRAKNLIRNGSMNFTEIAYYLSYSSLPYFSKQFRLATGMSPSAYASSVKGISDSLRPDDA